MMNRRINDKMINMVTGAEVMITAINGEEVTFDDGTVLTKDKVNACFKFVSNDTPYPAPAAEVTPAAPSSANGIANRPADKAVRPTVEAMVPALGATEPTARAPLINARPARQPPFSPVFYRARTP